VANQESATVLATGSGMQLVGEHERLAWPRKSCVVGDARAATTEASGTSYRAWCAHAMSGERRGLGEEGGCGCQVCPHGCGLLMFCMQLCKRMNHQCSISSGVFSRYRIYIFLREEGSLSFIRLTQGVTPMSTTRLYRGYVNWVNGHTH
jgi:hypothetical protein